MTDSGTSIQELEHLLELLRTELEQDRTLYKEKMLNCSVAARKLQGITWYPIAIRESYYGYGERLILEIDRPYSTEVPHMFQSGKVASLFSNHEDEKGENSAISGVVSSVRPDSLKLTLFVDELPDWADRGKLGLDLLFDELSYKEMEAALHRVMKAKNNRLSELREILLGHRKAEFLKTPTKYHSGNLNESQNKALNNALSCMDTAIIHGPPGTGKTTTLTETIIRALEEEEQVLVCAPSNTAVDLLTEKLALRGVNVLRIGNPSRLTEAVLSHSLDIKVTLDPEYKEVKSLRKKSAELRNLGLKYKRNFGKSERAQRKAILHEAAKLQSGAEEIERYIIEKLLAEAQVYTCTLVGSASYLLKEKNFHTVFIDEAAQALEPACWIPVSKAERVIFAGDHHQLPPTVKSIKAAEEGLFITLFEKCMHRQQVSVMLETQYRMHEAIMGFPNIKFYQNNLIADDAVKHKVLIEDSDDPLLSQPLEFIDTAGCGFDEKLEKESLSTYNPEEADLLLKHLTLLFEVLSLQSGTEIPVFRTGIISPYKAQVKLMEAALEKNDFLTASPGEFSVKTVDGFQGQERDIIYISLVRSNISGEIGFLADIRRMNVAMTRAKKKLVVFGDSATLARHPFYKDFIEYAEKTGAYRSAWEIL